jgi:hypothetical protein
MCVVGWLLNFYFWPTNDGEILMYQVMRMLGGEKLYQEIFEYNLPLIHLLYIFPTWLTVNFKIPPNVTLSILGTASVIYSLLTCNYLLKLSNLFVNKISRYIALLHLAVTLTILSHFFHVFSERAHLLICFSLPYILLLSPALRGIIVPHTVRFFIAFIAAIGFCLKPIYAVIWFVMQFYSLWKTRSIYITLFNKDNLAIYLFAISYLVSIYIFYPEYYFELFPIVLDTYGTLSFSFLHKLSQHFTAIIVIATTALILFKFREGKWYQETVFSLFFLIATTLEGVLSAGWLYVQYPSIAATYITMVMLYANYHNRIRRQFISMLALSGIVLVIACALMTISLNIALQNTYGQTSEYHYIKPRIKEFLFKNVEENSTYMLLSLNIWSNNLFGIRSSIKHVYRFDTFFTLRSLFYTDLKKNDLIYYRSKDYFFKKTSDDIRIKRPKYIIIDNTPINGTDIKLLDYLLKDKEFFKQMSRYKMNFSIDLCDETRIKPCNFYIYTQNNEGL